MSDQRQRRQGVVSARKWASDHETQSSRTAFKVPNGVKLFVVDKAGPIRLDFIPYVVKGNRNKNADDGSLHWERTFFVHRGVGANKETYVCPAKEAKLPCPICEYRNQRFNDPDLTEQEAKSLGEFKPKERQLFNVIDVNNPDVGIQLFEYSYFLFGDHLKKKIDNLDPEDDFDLFADPQYGYTLKIGVSEKKMDRGSYYEMSDIEFKNRVKPYDAGVIDEAHCLDDLIKLESYETLRRIFHQLPEGEEGDKDKKDNRKGPSQEAPTRNGRDSDDTKDRDEPRRGREAPKDRMTHKDDQDDDMPAGRGGHRKSDETSLKVGDQVEWDGKTCKIKKMSDTGDLLMLEDKEGDVYRAIPRADVKPVGKGERPARRDDKDDDVDDKPSRRSRKDDDDDDKPARTRSSKSKDDDDDKDDKDDKDDDDMPPPRNRRK